MLDLVKLNAPIILWRLAEQCKRRERCTGWNPQVKYIQRLNSSLLIYHSPKASLLFLTFMFYWNCTVSLTCRQSTCRAASSVPTQPQAASAPLPTIHPTACLQTSLNYNKATAYTCAGWFVSCRPNIPPPQSQQPVSVIKSVKEQQWTGLAYASLFGGRTNFTEILVLFPIIFFRDFPSRS